jgi:uncharacterized protein YoxC
MKDNFDLKKYLVENKATTQSKRYKIEESMSDEEIRAAARQYAGNSIPKEQLDEVIEVIIVGLRKLEALGLDVSKNIEDQNPSPEQIQQIMAIIQDINQQMEDISSSRFRRNNESINENLLNGLADYKVAFDIAMEIGVAVASVGFMIYAVGLKKTIEILKHGAKEFMNAVKYHMNKNK